MFRNSTKMVTLALGFVRRLGVHQAGKYRVDEGGLNSIGLK
jgi:hypothetical protein